MKQNEYKKLVAIYGTEKADKAAAWFVANSSPAFREAVHQAAYCKSNEYLWF